jgi:hypothetical protein
MKWRRSKFPLVAISICALLMVGGIAFAQTGGGFSIKWSSIDGGAVTMDDGIVNGYVLRGTIGQPEGREGVLSGGVYTLQGGITRLPAPVIIPPSGVTAAPGRNYYIDPSVTFRWTDVTYALGYWIEIARDKNFTQTVISDNTLPATQLSYPYVLPGNGTYYWRVRAKSKVTPLTWGPPSAIESLVIDIP